MARGALHRTVLQVSSPLILKNHSGDLQRRVLSNWKQAYERAGLAGFRPQHKGRQSYLTAEAKEAVLQWLQTKKIWELSELESHLAEHYDVVYESKQSYYDLFESAGISWKKTSKVNPKADAQAVAAKKPKSNGCWHGTGRRLNPDV